MAGSPDFSILDLVPVPDTIDGATALARVGDLAMLGDELGFKRIWYAEHHGMPAIASSSPEVLISHAAAITKRINVGSGGVMLPNHVPLRIVETYRTLNALYPGRIDLGLGRAGGTDSKTLRALHSFGGEHFAYQIAEMLGYANDVAPEGHPNVGVRAVPDGTDIPPIWILGSSGASADFAGQYGFGYGFAAHFSADPPKPAFDAYRAAFKPSAAFEKPHTVLCVAVVCCESEEEAQWQTGPLKLNWRNLSLGTPQRLVSPDAAAAFDYTPAEERHLRQRMQLIIVGTPQQVRDQIIAKAEETGADEVMIASTMYDHQARLNSFRLLAKELIL